ncbi:hypothetical protein MTO96_045353 [Rhipicephalus appendiculatus]
MRAQKPWMANVTEAGREGRETDRRDSSRFSPSRPVCEDACVRHGWRRRVVGFARTLSPPPSSWDVVFTGFGGPHTERYRCAPRSLTFGAT